eukprot:GFYU01007388.1.p1 GENE.GFYU01007388.1~~GFYU01007388.1.p1  ORF type:complete len:355 (-),score=82.13 GFYU01007388.1:177-1241(-)
MDEDQSDPINQPTLEISMSPSTGPNSGQEIPVPEMENLTIVDTADPEQFPHAKEEATSDNTEMQTEDSEPPTLSHADLRKRMGMVPSIGPISTPFPIVSKPSKRFKVGTSHALGRRPQMEDEVVTLGTFRGNDNEDFFAVFDGHGGKDASNFAGLHFHEHLEKCLQEHTEPLLAIRNAFRVTHEEMGKANVQSGTTALVGVFAPDCFYIANAGDSRAVMCKENKAVRLSVDHKPSLRTEEERINKLGGFVAHITYGAMSCSRVNGILAVSRALGDHAIQPYVTWEPAITMPLQYEENNQFIIFACDGLWDVVTDQEAVDLVLKSDDPQAAADVLKNTALERNSMDNVSVVVLGF